MNLEFFIVAPEIPDLIEVDDELTFISDKFAVHPQPALVGIVTAADIEREAQRNNADVLLFAAHNDINNGIAISDGYIAEDEIAAWVKQVGATLLILSVCNGAKIAKRVHRATGCGVLFCRIDVADREAMLYTARFVNALSRCKTYKDAYAFAGNAGGRFVLLEPKIMQGAISELTEQLKALGTAVTDLRIEMAELKAKMTNLEQKSSILPEPIIDPRWLWVFFALLLFIAGGIVLGAIR